MTCRLQDGQSQGSGTKRRFYFTRVETIDAMDVHTQGVRRSSVARGAGEVEDQGPYREVRRFKSTTYNGAHPGTGYVIQSFQLDKEIVAVE